MMEVLGKGRACIPEGLKWFSMEQLIFIFVDWILSKVVLRVCALPLSLHYPPVNRLLLLAFFVNLMVRVEEFFSLILPPTVLEDLLVCPLPMILPFGCSWIFQVFGQIFV